MNPAEVQDPLTFWQWAFALVAPAAVYCVLAALAWVGERHEHNGEQP